MCAQIRIPSSSEMHQGTRARRLVVLDFDAWATTVGAGAVDEN